MSDKNNNKKKFDYIVTLLIVMGVLLTLYNFSSMYRSFIRINSLRKDISRLDSKINYEQKKLDDLKRDIVDLDNVFYREKMIRKKLRMKRKGEEIYRFLNEK